MSLSPVPADPSLGSSIPALPQTRARVPGRKKAAIVVRLLAANGSRLPLSQLPEAVQADLVREVGALGDVDQETTAAVADEFAHLMESAHLITAHGLRGAVDLLGGSVAPSVANSFREQLGMGASEDPWTEIEERSAEDLLPILDSQSTEVGAVILTRLSVEKSAELLGKLPGPKARQFAYAVSKTSTVSADAARRIGVAVSRLLIVDDDAPATEDPVDQVGAMLNYSRSSTREDVLEGLEEADSEFADQVRRTIFTFAHIPERVEARDVPKIIRGIDQETLVQAFAGAVGPLEAARDFILGSMSQRMADMIREEVEDLGGVDEEQAEDAMGKIVVAIRTLEDAGEIKLITPEAES